jgi:hypothetical protein
VKIGLGKQLAEKGLTGGGNYGQVQLSGDDYWIINL